MKLDWTLPGWVELDGGAWTVTTSRSSVAIWHLADPLQIEATAEQARSARELWRQRDVGWFAQYEAGPEQLDFSRKRWDLTELGVSVDPELFAATLEVLPFKIDWKQIEFGAAREPDSMLLVSGHNWDSGICRLRDHAVWGSQAKQPEQVVTDNKAAPAAVECVSSHDVNWRRIVDQFFLVKGSSFHGSIARDVLPGDDMAARLLVDLVERGVIETLERSPTHSQAAFVCLVPGGEQVVGSRKIDHYHKAPWGLVEGNVEHHWYRVK